ncbi:MAG: 4Fe-4S dicluster domain-containing protein [Myxococcota bacterium]
MSERSADHRPFDVPAGGLTRRRFIGTTAAGLAAAALPGCAQPPPEKIVPYVHRPPEVIPGQSMYYATCGMRDGYAIGLLAETREGRPIKIEGHPHHPMSLGATGLWEQASTYGLYDPDRLDRIVHRGAPATWRGLAERMNPQGDPPHGPDGEGLHLFAEPSSSPLTLWLLGRLRETLPKAQVRFDPSAVPTQGWEATNRLYGRVLEPHYDFERIQVVVALDADFLTGGPASLRWARDFARKRHVTGPRDGMNRLYSVGPVMSVTQAFADERRAVRHVQVHRVARGLLAEIARRVRAPDALAGLVREHRPTGPHAPWIRAAAEDLANHRGRAVALVGPHQPAEVHILGHAINHLLGSVGETAWFARSPIHEAGADAFQVEPLLDALDGGAVRTLVVAGGNPAYAAPFRSAWRGLVPKAEHVVHLTGYRNETSTEASWLVPGAHPLESWGDARAYDGTLTLTQPAVRPLHGGRTVDQLLSLLIGEPEVAPRDLLQRSWADATAPGGGPRLDEVLAEGFDPGSAHPRATPEPEWEEVAGAARSPGEASTGWELVLRPDPCLHDGRYANNPWLQECPSPITKTVWDNAALLAPKTARELSVSHGDVVRIRHDERDVRLPVYVQPGQAEKVVVAHLGYGRAGHESVARGVGRDVGALRSMEHPWSVRGVEVEPTGGHHDLVTTQQEDRLHHRHVLLHASLEGWRANPDRLRPSDEPLPSFYPPRLTEEPQWGMNIDLTTCTGCSACVVACMVENNVPVVGKPQVGMGREMHWLRIDRYYSGDPDQPSVHMQPMLCQHCEHAPCEYVCPVNATVHSSDGLNEMLYHRCVGTRFCSNNCPYKVRRFNYLEWNDDRDEGRAMARNPDVTVRARGVMEKCTYCVQRIRRAQIEAKVDDVPLGELELQTACQQACPSRAIAFGAVSDPRSQVSRRNGRPHAFSCLEDLGTRPRTIYLADIDNPRQEGET